MDSQKTKKAIGNYILDLNQELGKGTFAHVYLGHKKNDKKVPIAIKAIEITESRQTNSFMKNLTREITILQKCNHGNIVKLYDVICTDKYVYICLEYCPGGDLKKLITEKKTIKEDILLNYFKQICSGFSVLYKNRIMHRDIKPGNFLLKDNQIKITDFGFARKISSKMDNPQYFTRLGSPLYMSPQILKGHEFSSKCDIWSLGIVLYQCLYGKTPYFGNTPKDLLFNIQKNTLKFDDEIEVSEELKELISKMLEKEEQHRISWPEIFQHNLIKDAENLQFQEGDIQETSVRSQNSIIKEEDKEKEETFIKAGSYTKIPENDQQNSDKDQKDCNDDQKCCCLIF